jgi:hypothetical protein
LLGNCGFCKISNKIIKTDLTITGFCKPYTKNDLVAKLIFVHIFFPAFFEEKLGKLLDQLTLAGYPVHP